MPRFVILMHEMPEDSPRGSHLDLMLEHQGVLRTWALEQPPLPSQIVAAERLPDHRLHYLDYEGAVSNDRGFVSRIDSGHYELIQDSLTTLVVQLHGQTIEGTLTLTSNDADHQRWRVSLSID